MFMPELVHGVDNVLQWWACADRHGSIVCDDVNNAQLCIQNKNVNM